MQLHEASELIKFPFPISTPQSWADLGSGEGLFTMALAAQLPSGSSILAIDKRANILKKIPPQYDGVTIHTQKGDFLSTDLPDHLQGVLMANALHYVKNKSHFLQGLIKHMGEGAQCLIVEYNTSSANPWVPYPINWQKVSLLTEELGAKEIHKLGEIPSLYQKSMYATLIRW